jgi:hypothetical protein
MKKMLVGFAVLFFLTCWGQVAAQTARAAVFNVKSYGARGNGTTNDTRAINTAAARAARVHGVLYLPHGTYNYQGTLSLPNGIEVRGDGIYQRSAGSGTWFKGRLDFGSNDYVHDLLVGRSGDYASRNRGGAHDTTLLRVRFRGGAYPSSGYGKAVVQLGGKGSHLSLSHVTFRNCEFERNAVTDTATRAPFHGLNTVSLWEDNRAGYSHIRYLSFVGCHFGVKNERGLYGASDANIEFKTNTWGGNTGTDFSHNYHHIAFRRCVFEKSYIFNVDLTDSARAWARRHGVTSGWRKIPAAVHGKYVTIAACTIKGGGQSGTFAYGICFENPYHWTVKNTTIYDGRGTGLDEPHASWECGGARILSSDGSRLGYLEHSTTDTPNVWQTNKVLAGFGSYKSSPYDP